MIAPRIPGLPRVEMPMLWSSGPFHLDFADDDADNEARQRIRGGLILDLDDTLYSREHFVLSGFAAAARHVAQHNDVSVEDAFTTLVDAYEGQQRGREFQVLCRQYRLPAALVPQLVGIFRDHRPSLSLRPAVVETIHSLRASGWRIAILTNGLPRVQAAKVEALDLARLVDRVLYAEHYAPAGKPAPAAFQAALTQLHLPAASCICVGDDVMCDVRGGRGAGMRTVRVVKRGVNPPAAEEADAVIDRFEDLPAALAALVDLVNVDVA